MGAETWPYFIEFALAVVFLVLSFVVSYGAVADIRKYKFLSMAWVYGVTAAVSIFMALELTYYDRDDGVYTQWGRWAMFTATHGAVALVLVQSMSYSFIDWALAFLFGTASAAFLLIGSLVPVRNCGNMWTASIIAVVLSAVAVIATSLLALMVARGWRRFGLFPLSYRPEDGRAMVMSMWWPTVASIALFLGLSAYTLLFALGPEGIPKSCSTGSSNKPVYTSEFTQIWLLFALVDGVVKFLFLPLVFLFINQDGAVTSTAFEVLQPSARVYQPTQSECRVNL